LHNAKLLDPRIEPLRQEILEAKKRTIKQDYYEILELTKVIGLLACFASNQ